METPISNTEVASFIKNGAIVRTFTREISDGLLEITQILISLETQSNWVIETRLIRRPQGHC